MIKFENLQTGLYLLVQATPAPGYYPVAPFLVSVPGMEGKEYIYDVNASPKLELEPSTPPTTRPTIPPTTRPTGPSLPQTGMTNWPVPAMAACGVLLVTAGWCVLNSGKKKTNEE